MPAEFRDRRCCFGLLINAGCSGEGSGESSSKSTGSDSKASKKETTETPTASETPAAAETVAAEPAPKSEPVAKSEPAAKPAAKKPVDPSATGSFVGTIVLDGDAPTLPPLTKAGDENLKDKEVCGAADVPDESLIVGDNKGIANVFVYLRKAPKGFEGEVPADAVVLDQKGCAFTPHVALIQAGQKVLVKSSDAIQHNVHTFPARNQGTNLLINPNDQVGVELTYAKAETDPLQVKCYIHGWMISYHLVLDHPFMALTYANGNFKIDGLPAGEYEFRVWHEKGGLLDKAYKTTITGEDEHVELKYAVDKFAG